MGFLSNTVDLIARAAAAVANADADAAQATANAAMPKAGGDFTGVITFPGVTDGGNAAAGDVGEYLESVVPAGSAVSLTNAAAANITSLSLTAGDWDVTANAGIVTAATTNVVYFLGSISTTSATVNTTDAAQLTWPGGMVLNTPGAGSPRITVARARISISAPTTVYLVARSAFTVSTASAFGKISARRVR